MADNFINLSCANCGGKLNIYDDMERFACGYCGSEMLVQRRGGTVALKAVTEAIRQVQVGTDKTAAELALVRYEKELQELNQRLTVADESSGKGYMTMGCGGLILAVGVVALIAGIASSNSAESFAVGMLIIAIGGGALLFGYDAQNSTKKRTAPILKRIAFVKQQMAEKKRIVDA